MDTTRPFGSPEFAIVAKGLVALHQQFLLGDDDSPDAEAIRDSLDGPMLALNQVDEKRAQWLSEDLYAVSEPSPYKTKETNPQAEAGVRRAAEAWNKHDWDLALELLRRWKDYLSPADLSFRRGAIWRGTGHLEAAAMFYGYAFELQPDNEGYRSAYMACVSLTNPKIAEDLAKEVLASPENFSTTSVTYAAKIELDDPEAAAGKRSVEFYNNLISIISANVAKIEDELNSNSVLRSAHGLNVTLLGACYRSLGDFERAIGSYTRGLDVNPDNIGLRTLRGVLSYDSASSINDFREATRSQNPYLWAYFFLAHHALIGGSLSVCSGLCQLALSKHGSPAAKSRLEEWRAIAQAGLGYPPDQIRAAFESAIRLDPRNETAKHNLASFEESLETSRASLAWERQSNTAISQFAELLTRSPSAINSGGLADAA